MTMILKYLHWKNILNLKWIRRGKHYIHWHRIYYFLELYELLGIWVTYDPDISLLPLLDLLEAMGLLPDTQNLVLCMRRGTFSCHRLQRKPLVSDPDMHHGTCVTHVPWCISGSLNRGGGENVPGIPGASATRNFSYLVRGPLNVWKSCWWRLTVNSVIVFMTILSHFPRLLQLQKSGLCFWFQTNYQLGVLW